MPLRDQKSSHHGEEHFRHRADEHPPAPKEDDSNWLISYADMMTLLCGFFIMLFSMATLDAPKYDSFKAEIAKQFGGEYVSTTKEMAKYATQIIQELGIETTTTIKSDSRGVSIVFESTVFFETLSSDVTTQGKKILEKIIESVMTRQKATGKLFRIVVEGHTDGRPIIGGDYPSNWELSGARAARVVRMFLDRGFLADHLTAIGYADTHPQVNARTQTGKWDDKALAKNRRVVLRILEPSVDVIPFPDDGVSGANAPLMSTSSVSAISPVPDGPRITASPAASTTAATALHPFPMITPVSKASHGPDVPAISTSTKAISVQLIPMVLPVLNATPAPKSVPPFVPAPIMEPPSDPNVSAASYVSSEPDSHETSTPPDAPVVKEEPASSSKTDTPPTPSAKQSKKSLHKK